MFKNIELTNRGFDFTKLNFFSAKIYPLSIFAQKLNLFQ
jgi:hypothetical protein